MATILPTSDQSVEATSQAPTTWQTSLRNAFRSGRQLCEYLEIATQEASFGAEADFPVLVTREFASRIRKGDPRDPLLLQVLSTAQELEPGGQIDPVGDSQATQQPGLLRKYQGRALLVTTGACAVHCRYCFRRHFPYQEAAADRHGWQGWYDTIADDPTIEEVILSGGDPLSVSDSRLQWFLRSLDALPNVRRIRIHTRLPIVLPSRVTETLTETLRELATSTYVVLHINHAQEIDAQVEAAVKRLRQTDTAILNQSVLLKGVNDHLETLVTLSQRLLDLQIVPYYLHQIDLVQGALHFGVTDAEAVKLHEAMRAHLPGYGVPQLVRETAGQPNKTPVALQ